MVVFITSIGTYEKNHRHEKKKTLSLSSDIFNSNTGSVKTGLFNVFPAICSRRCEALASFKLLKVDLHFNMSTQFLNLAFTIIDIKSSFKTFKTILFRVAVSF